MLEQTELALCVTKFWCKNQGTLLNSMPVSVRLSSVEKHLLPSVWLAERSRAIHRAWLHLSSCSANRTRQRETYVSDVPACATRVCNTKTSTVTQTTYLVTPMRLVKTTFDIDGRAIYNVSLLYLDTNFNINTVEPHLTVTSPLRSPFLSPKLYTTVQISPL